MDKDRVFALKGIRLNNFATRINVPTNAYLIEKLSILSKLEFKFEKVKSMSLSIKYLAKSYKIKEIATKNQIK